MRATMVCIAESAYGYCARGNLLLVAVRVVHIRFLRHAAGAVFMPQRPVYRLVPQEGAPGALLRIEFGALLLGLLDELGGVGGVVGSGEDGHGFGLRLFA